MRLAVMAVVLAIILAGCMSGSDSSDDDKRSIDRPRWVAGWSWLYTFTTPDEEAVGTRIVVAGEDGVNYLVGTASLSNAQRHAVLNLNPALGRVTTEELAVYENGEPQTILEFPLKKGSTWTYSLFGVDEFEAKVIKIGTADSLEGGRTELATVQAEGSDGTTLEYVYDSKAMWLRSLTHYDTTGAELLQMNLASFRDGYTGDVHFIRGRDLFDESYESSPGSPVADVTDTWADQGHPRWGAYTSLVVYLNYNTDSSGEGVIIVRDHYGTTQYSEVLGPDTSGTEIATIPSIAGNWTTAVELSGSSNIRLRIAGGIEYQWSV